MRPQVQMCIRDSIGALNNYAYYLSVERRDLDKAEGDILDEYEFDDNSTNVFGDDAMKRFDFGLGLKAGVEMCIRDSFSSTQHVCSFFQFFKEFFISILS